jgi:hypothetical protein
MLLPTVEPSSDCCFNAYDEAPDYNYGDLFLHICSARSGMILSDHQVLIWLGLFGHLSTCIVKICHCKSSLKIFCARSGMILSAHLVLIWLGRFGHFLLA